MNVNPNLHAVVNTKSVIDRRIDTVLKQLKPSSARELIDRVYRPYCHVLAETAARGTEDPVEMIDGSICLMANMLNEVGMATSGDPLKITKIILTEVERMVSLHGKNPKRSAH